MKILVVGGGGREHAIIKKLKEGDSSLEIVCCPGNGGISYDAACVDIGSTDIESLVKFASSENFDYAVVAQDDPLALGLVDEFEKIGLKSFGPDKLAARIESSKVFSKNLMKKYNIPTAEYEVFDDADDAKKYIEDNNTYPIVIKADGLALGKGVIICECESDALAAIDEIMVDKKFGVSGRRIVVEEFLTGPEVSILSFCDGRICKPLISSMDHKRALDGDKGLNTGGMGVVAPNPFYTEGVAKVCEETIFKPTLEAMREEGCPFRGCLYFGLMITEKGPKVIEYNCRFGDPEAQVVLPLLEGNLLEIMQACSDSNLSSVDFELSEEACVCIIMASGGYPQKYEKGKEIKGLNKGQLVTNIPDVSVISAGTKIDGEKLVTSGGRVLGLVAKAKDLPTSLNLAYENIDKIAFDGAFYRRDIGRRALTALENDTDN